ncbi:MAG TPA: TonB family protein [Bryobacteraceae bacterium]|nr:TonB family protein [Bryobacteraceae bacterium]
MLISAFMPQPDGSLRLGTAGKFHEEISLEIPAGFALEADAHLKNENAFARYQSDAKTTGGKLVIVREFQLKQDQVAGSIRAEVGSFWKMIGDDQKRAFVLRRTKRVDLTEWIQSIPADKTKLYGLQAYQQREYDASRQLFERATQANAKDLTAWNNLGRALAAIGKLEEAQAAYGKQIALNPKDPYAYNNLGLLQEREGYGDSAIQSFKKELEVRPGDPFAIANLPRALMQAGRWSEAEDAASRALQLQPSNSQQQLNLVMARICQGKVAALEQAVGAVLGVSPSGSLLNSAAYVLAECDKTELAESYIRRALDQLESTEGSARSTGMAAAIRFQNARRAYLDTYGWLLFKKGENDRAISLLNAAASLAPDGVVYAHLAQAESKAGHGAIAGSAWREAALLQPGRLPLVPPDVAAQLDQIKPLSFDRVWFPLGADLPGQLAEYLRAGQPSYFFLASNADGSIQSVRELDIEDQAAGKLVPALRAIRLPVIQVETAPLPRVFFVKLMRGADGKVIAARSVSNEAVAIASELMPGEFALPDESPQPAGDAERVGGDVSAPSIKFKVEPEYSEEARIARFQGAVLLFIVVDNYGLPRDIKVLRSLGLGLDEKAIAAVSKWQFNPGQKSGVPVNVQAQIEVNFRLQDNDQKVHWRLTRAEFNLAAGGLRPTIDKVAAPHVAGDATAASATVRFDVDETGMAVDVRVEKTSDDEWSRDVANALRKWKFTPGSRDGSAVLVPCRMDFVRGN